MTQTSLPSASPQTLAPGMTAGQFLFGSDPVAALRERLAGAGVLDEAGEHASRVRRAALGVVEQEVARVVDGFLVVDLAGTLAKGWTLHSQLRVAGEETLTTPGLTTVVELATHTVKAGWKPRVDVAFDAAPAAPVVRLSFELALTFRVVGLLASVTGGRLTSLAGGRGELSASFSVGGRKLAARSAPFDPHVAVPLGQGIPLATAPIPQQPTVDVVVLPDDEAPGDVREVPRQAAPPAP